MKTSNKTAKTSNKKEQAAKIKATAYEMTGTSTTKELKAIFSDLDFRSVDGFAAVIARMGRGSIETVKKGKKIVKVWVEASIDVTIDAPEFVEVKETEVTEIIEAKENTTNDNVSFAQDVIDTIKEFHDNYIPLYIFREYMPTFSRGQQDNALFELERTGKIELSSIAEPQQYTEKQRSAGIAQLAGGDLFFIIAE